MYQIMQRVQAAIQDVMIDRFPESDPTRVGVVKLGNLDGEPDPDIARISLTIFENDPDSIVGGAVSSIDDSWEDEDDDDEAEIGFAVTKVRRYTVKIRCLFDTTQEDLDTARSIATTVRIRLEHLLPIISFSGIDVDGEYVSMRIYRVHGELLQSGGPPNSYDFLGKVRFELKTTKVYTETTWTP